MIKAVKNNILAHYLKLLPDMVLEDRLLLCLEELEEEYIQKLLMLELI